MRDRRLLGELKVVVRHRLEKVHTTEVIGRNGTRLAQRLVTLAAFAHM